MQSKYELAENLKIRNLKNHTNNFESLKYDGWNHASAFYALEILLHLAYAKNGASHLA